MCIHILKKPKFNTWTRFYIKKAWTHLIKSIIIRKINKEHIYTQSKLSVIAPPRYGSTLNTFSALRVIRTKKIDTTQN